MNEFKYRCVPGFTANNCETEIDEYDSNPCHNGGSCYYGLMILIACALMGSMEIGQVQKTFCVVPD